MDIIILKPILMIMKMIILVSFNLLIIRIEVYEEKKRFKKYYKLLVIKKLDL